MNKQGPITLIKMLTAEPHLRWILQQVTLPPGPVRYVRVVAVGQENYPRLGPDNNIKSREN